MKKETELYHDLFREMRQYCTDNRLGHHIVRIESNLTQQGIPDINCCIEGKEFWIEVKYNYFLNPLQISWREQRNQAGGRVFTIQLDEDGKYNLFYKQHFSFYNNMKDIVSKIFEILEIGIK